MNAPPQADPKLQPDRSPAPRPRSQMVIGCVVIPLIVALVVGSVYLQRGRVRQVADLRQEMSQSLVLAEEAGNDDQLARQNYNQLLALASEAEELRPGDPGAEGKEPGISNLRRRVVLMGARKERLEQHHRKPYRGDVAPIHGEDLAPVPRSRDRR